MPGTTVLIAIILSAMAALYVWGHRRALASVGGAKNIRKLHSLPGFYGVYTALWAGLPALFLLLIWGFFQNSIITYLVVNELPTEIRNQEEARLSLVINDIKNRVAGGTASVAADDSITQATEHFASLQATASAAKWVLVFLLLAGGGFFTWRSISPRLRARNQVEGLIKAVLILCALLAIFTTIGIVLSVLFESLRFFQLVPLTDFLFGLHWNPGTLSFGAVPLFAGTLLISLISMLIAVPIGLLAAVYLSEYAGSKMRAYTKPILEILAGVPTVVYGFFAALTVAPFISDLGGSVGLSVSSESALAAGLVMGIMIIPFVSSLSDDVINSVPQAMRDASYGLGATRSETIRRVILPAALPGIVGSILLAVSRAIGETMIVVMAAGLSAKLTANPFEAVTTVTVQIVTALVGDNEFDSPKTLVAFALGLVLFILTLGLNVLALHVVRKYREQYE